MNPLKRLLATFLTIAAFCIFACLWHVAVNFLTSIGLTSYPFNLS